MKIKKMILPVLMIATTVLSCGMMVSAESYKSTLCISSTFDGKSRKYTKGSTLYCNVYNAYLDTPFSANHKSDVLYIEALKNDWAWIFYHKVGSQQSKTVYYNKKVDVCTSFKFDGSGDYKFRFTKRDALKYGGQETIVSKNVQMGSK